MDDERGSLVQKDEGATTKLKGIVTRFAVVQDETGEQGQLASTLEHYQFVFGHSRCLVTDHRGVRTQENDRPPG